MAAIQQLAGILGILLGLIAAIFSIKEWPFIFARAFLKFVKYISRRRVHLAFRLQRNFKRIAEMPSLGADGSLAALGRFSRWCIRARSTREEKYIRHNISRFGGSNLSLLDLDGVLDPYRVQAASLEMEEYIEDLEQNGEPNDNSYFILKMVVAAAVASIFSLLPLG